MNPLVSILIPVYNREHIIQETINCALNQTYKNIEVIICDNCSTDNTWAILQKIAQSDNRIKIFQNEKNLGPVLNWKECLDKAQGEYSKILWSDDLISDTFVEHTLSMFDAETAFVLTGLQIFDSATKEIIAESPFQKQSIYTSSEYLRDCIIENKKEFPVSPGCALFRTSDLKQSLTVDIPNTDNLNFKNYGAGNDFLFYLITASNYALVKSVGQIESYFRAHTDSISIERGNKLDIYYEWAKCYFINEYYPALSKEYKAKMFRRKIKYKIYRNLYRSIKVTVSYSFLISSLIKRMIKK